MVERYLEEPLSQVATTIQKPRKGKNVYSKGVDKNRNDELSLGIL